MYIAETPQDIEKATQTLSNPEIKQLIESYREEMSPNCLIFGCAVCGVALY